MSAFDELIDGMVAGRSWPAMGDTDAVRVLMGRVYDERYHGQKHFKDRYQPRVNLQKKDDSASYAGWITSENPPSGPYQGTSFVWFPGPTGSVAVLVIGTDGFGPDTHILGRPGHARRLRALKRLHGGELWVKPDLLDLGAHVPEVVTSKWPDISAAVRAYGHVIYAAVAVNDNGVAELVSDLLDLFFDEHGTPLTGNAKARWERRRAEINGAVFPAVDEMEVLAILRMRRFLILEGPPGTGKTRLAYRLAERIGSSTRIQFHPEEHGVRESPKKCPSHRAVDKLVSFRMASDQREAGIEGLKKTAGETRALCVVPRVGFINIKLRLRGETKASYLRRASLARTSSQDFAAEGLRA